MGVIDDHDVPRDHGAREGARTCSIDEEIAAAQPVLAQIGETVFDGGFLFLVLQVFTAGILILAANTAFQDFPRLSSILARDRFMPSQFREPGRPARPLERRGRARARSRSC